MNLITRELGFLVFSPTFVCSFNTTTKFADILTLVSYLHQQNGDSIGDLSFTHDHWLWVYGTHFVFCHFNRVLLSFLWVFTFL
jgi:hypothetical protein